jgi:hypothetical protein
MLNDSNVFFKCYRDINRPITQTMLRSSQQSTHVMTPNTLPLTNVRVMDQRTYKIKYNPLQVQFLKGLTLLLTLTSQQPKITC